MKLHLPKMLFAAVMACFSLVQAATLTTVTGKEAVSVNINFASGSGAVPATDANLTIGGISTTASQWNNLTGATGTNVEVKDTEGRTYKVTYSSPNTWTGSGTTDSLAGNITKGYLDISNAGGNGVTITLTNADGSAVTTWSQMNILFSGDGGKYGGVGINGTNYCYDGTELKQGTDAWGTRTGNTTFTEGTNLMIYKPTGAVNGLTITAVSAGGNRASIAGLQVVTGLGAEKILSAEINDFKEGESAYLIKMADKKDDLSSTRLAVNITPTAAVGDVARLTVDRNIGSIVAKGGVFGLVGGLDATIGSLAFEDGASLGLIGVSAGKTLTIKDGVTGLHCESSGTGTLALGMANAPGADGDCVINLGDTCKLSNIRIDSGAIATNKVNSATDVSKLGSANLILGGDTTYAVRTGIGESANITKGGIFLDSSSEHKTLLMVYGALKDDKTPTLSNNISALKGGSGAYLRKTDDGSIRLTGQVDLDGLYVAAGTLILGNGNKTTVDQLRLSENGANGNTLRIEKGATLTVTGTDNSLTTSASLLLAHWNQTGFLEVDGGLLSAKKTLARMSWTGTGTLSLNSGAVSLAGVSFAAENNTVKGVFNLGSAEEGSGTFELGAMGITDVNNNAVINLGNGTIKLAANSSITRNEERAAGKINLIGVKGGTKINTNGHTLNIDVAMSGDGNLVKTGKGTLSVGDLTTTGTITISSGTLRLDGEATISNVITNNATLAIGKGRLSLASLESFGVDAEYTDKLAPTSGNGYIKDAEVVIIKASEGKTSKVEGLNIVYVSGTPYDVINTDTESIVSITSANGGAYYINNGTVDYGASNNSAYADNTTGLALTGGNLTLSKALKNRVQHIQVSQDATVSIGKDVSLAYDRLDIGNDAQLTLAGSGLFEIGDTMTLPGRITLGDKWTGTVVVDGMVFGQGEKSSDKLNTGLSTSNSYVGITNATGWLAVGGTVSANIHLLAGDAVSLTDGSSNRIQTFSGKIKGEGDFAVNMVGKGCTGITYVFSNDVSQWTGTFKTLAPADKTFNLQFLGSGNIGTSVSNAAAITLNVTIGGTGARTINGSIANKGTLNLTLTGDGAKTFTKDISVSTLDIGASVPVSLKGDSTIGTLTTRSTITNTGSMQVTQQIQDTVEGATWDIMKNKSTFVLSDGTTKSPDGNGFISTGFYSVVTSTGAGKLTLGQGVALGDNFQLSGNNLLYKVDPAKSAYYINKSTTYTGGDAANVQAGKTILIQDGADLKLTDTAFTNGVIVKTLGTGSVTLDLGKGTDLGAMANLFSGTSTTINRLIISKDTRLEITGSGQTGSFGKIGTVVVKSGGSFSDRLAAVTLAANVDYQIAGHGVESDGDDAGALVFGKETGKAGDFTLGGKVTLTGDATICTTTQADRVAVLAGEFTGNGHTLIKTGANILKLGATVADGVFTGSDKTMDAALDIRRGEVFVNFTSDSLLNGADSHKISGKVTMADGTTLNIGDGYTELSGGLAINGTSTINSVTAKGLKISKAITGAADSMLRLTRVNAPNENINTLVLAADSSKTFTGLLQVDGRWDVRVDNAYALAGAVVNLNDENKAKLSIGEKTKTVKLLGLMSDKTTSAVSGVGTVVFTGTEDFSYAGQMTVDGLMMLGKGKQTLATVKAGADLTVRNGGTLAFTNAIIANNISLSNGTLDASVTLNNTLSGKGALTKLVSTDASAISLDVKGAKAAKNALISIDTAVLGNRKLALSIANIDTLGYGYYNLLSWDGIKLDQFAPVEKYDLKVVGNNLQLCVLPQDFYWKGTDNVWEDNLDVEWAQSMDKPAEFYYSANKNVHFIGSGADITVSGTITAKSLETAGGDWSFTTPTGSKLTVGDVTVTSGTAALSTGTTIKGGVKMGNGTKLTLPGKLTSNGMTFQGVVIDHTGALESFGPSASKNFTVTGGSITNAGSADKIAFTLSGVALTQSGTGKLTLSANNTLTSLTTKAGSVVLAGTTKLGGDTLSKGATVTTGGAAFDMGSTATTITGGAVTTDATGISAKLSNVALTTTKDTTITGKQVLASLTTGSNSATLVDTTIGGTNLSGSEVTTGSKVFSLGSTTTKVTAGTVTTDASTISAALTKVDLTTKGAATINGTQDLTNLTAGGKTTITGKVDVTTVHGDITLGGSGTLNTAGELNLAGASSIGDLKAEKLNLGNGATLRAGILTLASNKIGIAGLTGINSNNHLLDAAGGITDIEFGITLPSIKQARFDDMNKLVLGEITGLQSATFDKGAMVIDDPDTLRHYEISTTAGTVLVTRTSNGNGWVGSGTWETGGATEFGTPVEAAGNAAFLGDGSDVVTVSGGQNAGIVVVDVQPQTTVSAYTFEGDTITSDTLMVCKGELTVNNTIKTGLVDVDELDGTLNIGSEGAISTAKALGTITNDGKLTMGNGSDVTLLGNGALATSGNTEVAMGQDATISALTNSGKLTLTTDTTAGGLNNTGSIDAGANTLALTDTTQNGGTVTADTISLATGDNAFTAVNGNITGNKGGELTLKGNVSNIASIDGGDLVADGSAVVNLNSQTVALDNLTVAQAARVSAKSVKLAAMKGAGQLKADDLTLTGDHSEIGTLDVSSVWLDADKLSTDKSLLAAGQIVSGTDVTLGNFTPDSVAGMEDGVYTLVDTQDTDKLNLLGQDDITQEVAIRMNKYAHFSKDNGLYLSVQDDSDRTWHTSELFTYFGDDGETKVLNVAAIMDKDIYHSLDTVRNVDVNASTTIDLTSATRETEDTDGLLISNLTGKSGSTLTLAGTADDLATLYNSKDTTGAEALELRGLTVKVAADGGSSLQVGDVTLDAGATLDVAPSAKLAVKALNGSNGTLSGTVSVVGKGGFYSGSYKDATVQMRGGKQTLQAASGLTVAGDSGTATIIVEDGSAIDRLATTGATVELANSGLCTLTLNKESTMTNGTLKTLVNAKNLTDNLGDAKNAPVLTTGAALHLKGVDVTVDLTDASHLGSLNLENTGLQKDIVLFLLNDNEDSTVSGSSITLTNSEVLDKYFTNIHLKQGSIEVVGDRQTDYYGSKLSGISANGETGLHMAGIAASYVDPQHNRDKYADLADVMDALDACVAAGDSAGADRIGAALAGASVATIGAAQSADMDRQLRTIRNRVVTMGAAGQNIQLNDQKRCHAWVDAEGDYNRLKADNTAAGYTLSSWGGTVGFDYDTSTRFTAGVAVTSMMGKLKADGPENSSSGDTTNYYLTMFGRYATGSWVHSLVFAVNRFDASMDRTVSGAAGSYSTTGETSGLSFGALYEVGYKVPSAYNSDVTWQPFFNASFRHIAVDGYRESGNDAALKVGDQTMDCLTMALGARAQMVVGESVYNRASTLELRAMAKAELGDRSSTADVSLLSLPSYTGSVESAEHGAFGLEVGAQLLIPVGVDSGTLIFDLSAETRGKTSNFNAVIGYRLSF